MKPDDTKSQFEATLLRAADLTGDSSWAFVVLPRGVSEKLPRRGRTTVVGAVNGHEFMATLEPDGNLSHWLRIDQALLETSKTNFGDTVTFEIMPAAEEQEPEVPSDLLDALAAAPEAQSVWHDTTTIARVDWVHWITSAKQPRTRAKRIGDACQMLASGKRRVCCFDPSGYYSKALSAPKVAG